jgi:hypothetical protein
MRRFRIPEIFLGCFLTVAVFAAGMTIESARNQPSQPNTTTQSASSNQDHKEESTVRNWIFHDAAGFFTAWLVMVGFAQAGLFLWQLRYMGKGMKDATIAARAAQRSAVATIAQAKVARDSAIKLQRPYIFVFGVSELLATTTEFYVNYTVANYGAIPAILEDVFVGFIFSDRGALDVPSRIWDDHDLSIGPIFEASEKRGPLAEFVPNGIATGGSIVVPDGSGGFERARTLPDWDVPPGSDIFFRVVIRYRGPFSSGHETSATWLCDRGSPQLIQRGGEDYNYNR